MGEKLLTVKNLSAWYSEEKTILSDFYFELAEHEVAGLIGLNGAGKTTFLKVLSGLLATFRSEDICFSGSPVDFRKQEFKLCRYTVFAEDNSFSYFTFREYLAYVCAAYGRETPDVSELIRGFHFEEYADTLLRELSTGNRKKAFLITAFALKPRLLLLDEPVNGLDFQSTEYLYQQILGYKEYGCVLFSSHILESITLTSDRVFVLENGKVRQTFERGQINAADIREALHDENNR
ncbi:MAG: ABC transporter ATP-binding protein [Lachnospiraceae bacterium]